jgi:hypothetical protein
MVAPPSSRVYFEGSRREPLELGRRVKARRPTSRLNSPVSVTSCPPDGTRRAYRIDIHEFMAFMGIGQPEEFRKVTRAHVLAWRKDLEKKEVWFHE